MDAWTDGKEWKLGLRRRASLARLLGESPRLCALGRLQGLQVTFNHENPGAGKLGRGLDPPTPASYGSSGVHERRYRWVLRLLTRPSKELISPGP